MSIIPFHDHNDKPSPTPNPFNETLEALSQVAVTAPLAGDGTASNPITLTTPIPPDEWEEVGGIVRPIASPTSVQISTATGNVGINAAPSGTWENVFGGNTLIDGAIQKRAYQFLSETTITVPTIVTSSPWWEIATNIPTIAAGRVSFEFFSNGDRSGAVENTARVSGSLTHSANTIVAMEVSSLGDRTTTTAVYAGSDGGFLKFAVNQTGLSGGSMYIAKIYHGTQDSSLWTSASMATAPAWTANPSPTTQFRTGEQWINRFGNIAIAGQITSSLRTTVATITATGTLPATATRVLVNNGATNITITLPDPALHIGRELWFTRASTSTGTITLAPAAGQVQALAGTLGATTSITALGNSDSQSVHFFSDGINWYR